jgi:alanine racemase
MPLRARATINLAAIERNVTRLRSELSSRTAFCAVVKADGYGHGATMAARAAQSAGAGWLAVATAEEAAALRRDGISGRLLVMGALSASELEVALRAQADIVAWDDRFLADVSAAIGREPSLGPARVHVKLDTGMGRLGTRLPERARELAERAAAGGAGLTVAGVMTHLATADEEDREFMTLQLARFAAFVAELREAVPGIVVHAANSAATLREPASHHDLVRCGIAIYGGDPANRDPADHGLEPAMALESYVAAVKWTRPGESAGYGRRFTAGEETWLATLPIGYGDGVRRAFTNNCDVLIGGRRHPLVGTVSMDNITVDLGPESRVEPGTPAVLIGRDGGERQTAEELARRIGTINYEIICGITARVPREYHRDGVELADASSTGPA